MAVTWSSVTVIALRNRLGMDRAAFARLAGVDNRTASRWESNTCTPSGTAAAVLGAIREKLDNDPAHAAKIVDYIVRASDVYLMLKLLDGACRP